VTARRVPPVTPRAVTRAFKGPAERPRRLISGRSDGGGGLPQRILRGMRPAVPLRDRIGAAQKRLESQIDRLNGVQEALKKRDAAMLQKIADAQRAGNAGYARGYAQELGEVRRMRGVVRNAQLAMEGVRTRLDTVAEYGDVVVTLSPCMALVRDIAPGLGAMVPGVNESLGDFERSMREVLEGSSTAAAPAPEAAPAGPDAEAILEEARAAAQAAAEERLPDAPPHGIVPQGFERLPPPPVDLREDVLSDRQVYT